MRTKCELAHLFLSCSLSLCLSISMDAALHLQYLFLDRLNIQKIENLEVFSDATHIYLQHVRLCTLCQHPH